MSSATLTRKKEASVNVGMGMAVTINANQEAKSVLGSCIGLVIWDEIRNMAAVAHIVLARGQGRNGPPGKFADTAIPWMINELKIHGCKKSSLVAKLAGGANMLAGSGPIQIGASNHAAVVEILGEHGVPIVGEHVGGSKGRRVLYTGSTGAYAVEVIGEPVVTL